MFGSSCKPSVPQQCSTATVASLSGSNRIRLLCYQLTNKPRKKHEQKNIVHSFHKNRLTCIRQMKLACRMQQCCANIPRPRHSHNRAAARLKKFKVMIPLAVVLAITLIRAPGPDLHTADATNLENRMQPNLDRKPIKTHVTVVTPVNREQVQTQHQQLYRTDGT